MLSIHYVSMMMSIFYIDWQQYWKWDWILNIGANALGKRTVSTVKDCLWASCHSPLGLWQPQHKWQTWQSGFQWHRSDLCMEHVELVLVTRLCHSATIFFMLHVFVFETSPDFFFCGGRGGTKLQCIYYLVTYTDLWAAKGISAFQTSLLYKHAINTSIHCC